MSTLSTTTPTAAGIAAPPAIGRNPGGTARLRQWQPAISLAIVLVLLGGLFAIAWDRQMRNPDQAPTMLAALQDDDGTPHPIESINFNPECVAQNLGAPIQLNGQWSLPDYTPAMLWVGDPQLDIYQMFITYVACQDERDGGNTPTDDERTYLSPRLLFLIGSDEPASALMGANSQGTSELFDPTQRIISDFPLPLNRYPAYSSFNVFEGEFGAYPPFEYWDIHALPGDRWAAMGGSISTHMLQTGMPIRTGDGELAYISFIAQGDGYVIDEYFLICPSDIAASLDDDTDGSLAQQEPFDPAELIRNPGATCG